MEKQLRVGHDRVRLHGPRTLERLQAAQRFLPCRAPPGPEGGLRAQRRQGPRSSPDAWGYERVETDWRKLVEAPDIDLIDICSPNDTHHEIALAAAKERQDGAHARSRWR